MQEIKMLTNHLSMSIKPIKKVKCSYISMCLDEEQTLFVDLARSIYTQPFVYSQNVKKKNNSNLHEHLTNL